MGRRLAKHTVRHGRTENMKPSIFAIAFSALTLCAGLQGALASPSLPPEAGVGRVVIDRAESEGRPNFGVDVDLQIVGSTSSQVSVHQTMLHGNAAWLHAKIVQNGTTVHVTPVYDGPQGHGIASWLHFGPMLHVRWRIQVPRSATVEANTSNGDIHIDDVSGNLRLRTSNGEIAASNVGSQVDAATSNGSVHIALGHVGTAPQIRVRSSNGNIHIRVPKDFNTHVNASTSNGSIENPFKGASGPGSVRLSTSNGSVIVSRPP